ncbi:hypothetical protein [Cohnella sp. GCM10012308]|uniref:hypothetical protein n=1 Tax=Cohnella sp. GCM10012308 TaxID=3317329 RepID=UPI0036124CD7
MSKITWTLNDGSGAAEKEQIEHIPTIKASEDGADKETVRLWNLMVKTLKDNGLMKDK